MSVQSSLAVCLAISSAASAIAALSGCTLDALQEQSAASPEDHHGDSSAGPGDAQAAIYVSALESAISEAGDPAYFDFVLASRPMGPVVISLELTDPAEAQLSQTVLAFTPSTWDTPQTIEVLPVDDNRFDGDVSVYIISSVTSPDPRYAVVELPALDVLSVDDDYVVTGYRSYPLHPDPTESRATTINNRGQAIVEWRGDGHDIRPFLWEAPTSSLIDLAVTLPPMWQSHALDLNDAGVAVGWSDAVPGQWVKYQWPNVFAQPGEIWAINDRGHMAGEALFIAPGFPPHLSSAPQRVDIHGGNAVTGLAINNRDHVTGLFPTPPFHERAFYWNGVVFEDLGSFGGPRAAGQSINHHDQIVGRMFDTEFNYQPFYYENGQIIRLPNLSGSAGGWANGINNRGDIVGTDLDLGRMPVNAWVGTRDNLRRLDQLLVDGRCFFSIDAIDINDRGQVIGNGIECDSGTHRGYVFEPIKVAKPGCEP